MKIFSFIINVSCSGPTIPFDRFESPLIETNYLDLDIRIFCADPYELVIVYWNELAVAELFVSLPVGDDAYLKYEEVVEWVEKHYDEIKLVAKEKQLLPIKTYAEINKEYYDNKQSHLDFLKRRNEKEIQKIKAGCSHPIKKIKKGFEKLHKRPVENDTAIIKTQEETFDGIKCLLEMWTWDGISACSAIYLKDDVSHMSLADLTTFTLKHVNSSDDNNCTSKESGDYIFINYGFFTM